MWSTEKFLAKLLKILVASRSGCNDNELEELPVPGTRNHRRERDHLLNVN